MTYNILLSLGIIDEHYLCAIINLICRCNVYAFVHEIEVHVKLMTFGTNTHYCNCYPHVSINNGTMVLILHITIHSDVCTIENTLLMLK